MRSRSCPRNRSAIRKGRPRPRVELLEARTLLSTIVVDTLGDVMNPGDGVTSLREAIALAAATSAEADTIVLPGGTFALPSGRLTVNNPTGKVTLQSLGGTTIHGGGTTRVLDVAAGSEVEMIGITVTGGSFSSGGGIANFGTLTLTSSTIVGNTATFGRGGGIENRGTLTLTRTTVDGNTAPGPNGIGGGGGIANYGALTIDLSTIHGNTAAQGDGGGIFNDFGSMAITFTDLTDNASPSGFGGGIQSLGGTATLTGCVLQSNTAQAGGGLNVDSGAMDINQSSIRNNTGGTGGAVRNYIGTVSIADTNVDDNTALYGAGGIDNGGDMELSASAIRRNIAGGDGGGISNGGTLAIINSVIADNIAGGAGGGVSTGSPLTIVGTTIDGNSAIDGGGLACYDDVLTLTDSTISGNTARGGAGGLPDLSGGGGLANRAGTVTIIASTVRGNTADEPDSTGGGIVNGSGSLSVTSSLISENSSARGGGGIDNAGTLLVRASTIRANIAAAAGNGRGGGILNWFGGTATVTASTIHGNMADEAGGGVYSISSTTTIVTSTISGNTSAGNAGGLFNHAGNVTVSASTVAGNTSLGVGAGLYNLSGVVTVASSIIAGNLAFGTDPHDLRGSFASQGHNLIGFISGGSGFGAAGDQVGSFTPIDPRLGPLQDNGGPSWTHALSPGSPALDTGDAILGGTTDQRGVARPQGTGVDIGAYEFVIVVVPDTVAESPLLIVSDAPGLENTPIPLDIEASLRDTDGSETLTITIEGVAGGATLSAGSDQGGGYWILTPAELPGLCITVSPYGPLGVPIPLTVTAMSIETSVGATAFTTATLVVMAAPVNNAPFFRPGEDVAVAEDSGPRSVPGWATDAFAGPAVDEWGQLLTFELTGNSNPGLFSVPPAINSDGTLSFSPAPDASGSALLTVVLRDDGGTLNGGEDTSSEYTFILSILAVNDAPTFMASGDINLAEDAGAQSISDWAGAIQSGPADESSQALTFQVTGNTNPGLFAVAPMIAADGTLTFSPAAGARGSATLTVVLRDDGGTLDGGQDTTAPQSFSINIVNVAPTTTLSGAGTGVVNQVLEFSLGASDLSPSDQAAGFTYEIDWGDGTGVQVISSTPGNGSGVHGDHAFAAAGSYTIRARTTDQDGDTGPDAVLVITIENVTPANLQDIVADAAASGTEVTLLTTSDAQVSDAIVAINAVQPPVPGTPVTLTIDLAGGTYHTETAVATRAGVTLIIRNGTLLGGSPALTVDGGVVFLENVVATNDTDAPTILVQGGSLIVRGSTILESSGFARAAILVTGGTVDLGTASVPGGNILNVRGAGELIRVTGAADVSAIGNLFQVNGTPLATGYAIEDKVFHALDAGGGGLVRMESGGIYVTVSSGSVQRAIDVAPQESTVHVAAGVPNSLVDLGSKHVTLAFDGGPTIAFLADPLSTTQAMLSVWGTPGDDKIKIRRGDDPGEILVKIRDEDRLRFRASAGPVVGRIAVHGGSGDDDIEIGGNVTTPAWIYGEGGNDRINGGDGNDVVIGGDGDDLLSGGGGRDLLIGGAGADRIVGNADDDILIAGSTSHDAVDLALAAIMAEWTSTRSYARRVANLRGDATGDTFGQRSNGGFFLAVDGTHGRSTTVFDDGAADVLTGNIGMDWFLFNADGDSNAKKDKVTDLTAAEFKDDLDFLNGTS